MPSRTIDAPRHQWSSTEEACEWLGLGETLFEQEVERAGWMRPRWFGEGRRRIKKWFWLDVVCLNHVLHVRAESPMEGP